VDLPGVTVGIEVVDRVVSEHYGMAPTDLAEHGRRVGPAKFVAVELACRMTGASGRAVGQRYGGISSAAVSIIRRKIRQGEYEVAPVVFSLQQRIAKSKRRPVKRKVNI
jgi:hypothetical protein